MTYGEYIEKIPKSTEQFVREALDLISVDPTIGITLNGITYYLIDEEDKILCCFFKKYDEHKSPLDRNLGDVEIQGKVRAYGEEPTSIEDTKWIRTFMKLEKTIFPVTADLASITPENIIISLWERYEEVFHTPLGQSALIHMTMTRLIENIKVKVPLQSKTAHISQENVSELADLSEKIFTSFSIDALDYLDELAKYYNYLNQKQAIVRKNIILNESDILPLANLLYLLSVEGYYSELLSKRFGNLDDLLELLNLESKEEFLKGINDIEGAKDDLIGPIETIVGEIEVPKSTTISRDTIIKKLFDARITNSNVIARIIKQDSFDINQEITRDKLAPASEAVCSFLYKLISYYNLVTKEFHNSESVAPIAIILAALDQDALLRAYMNNNYQISIAAIRSDLKIKGNLKESPIDIDVLERVFGKYIFPEGQDLSQVTVHSIFERAFNPKLGDITWIKGFLHEHNAKIEDFHSITNRLASYKYSTITNTCTGETQGLLTSALRFYNYIMKNIKEVELVNNEADAKELALTLALFYEQDLSTRFFHRNGVELERILEATKLPPDLFSIVKDTSVNPQDIAIFSDYINLEQALVGIKIERSNVIEALVGKCAQRSIVLEILANRFYRHMSEELKSGKNIPLTLDEELKLLEIVKPLETKESTKLQRRCKELTDRVPIITEEVMGLAEKTTIVEASKVMTLLTNQIRQRKKADNASIIGVVDTMFDDTIPPLTPEEIEIETAKIETLIEKLLIDYDHYILIAKYIKKYMQLLGEYIKKLGADKRDIESAIGETLSLSMTQVSQLLIFVNSAIETHRQTILRLMVSKNVILPSILSQSISSDGYISLLERMESDVKTMLSTTQYAQVLETLKESSSNEESQPRFGGPGMPFN